MNRPNKRSERFRAFDRLLENHRLGRRPLACRKVGYSSKSEAKSALRWARASGKMTDKHLLNFYYCGRCDSWHIGHVRAPAPGEGGAGP